MVWTIRITLIVLLSTLLYIYALNILRFFRPSNARAMIMGPLPRIQQLGGKIAGVEATASLADTDLLTKDQLAAVEKRIDDLMERVDSLAALAENSAPGEEIDDKA